MRNLTLQRRGITYARQHGLICEMIDGTERTNGWRLAILHHHRRRLELVLRRVETRNVRHMFSTPFNRPADA